MTLALLGRVWELGVSDIETANWSETAASNNAVPPNGWPEGMALNSVGLPFTPEYLDAARRSPALIDCLAKNAGTI
jgi:hypothetical protein